MPSPTYGFDPIDREYFYENMNHRLSRPEIVGKIDSQSPSAMLYFMGRDLTDERPDNDIRMLDPNGGVVCGQGKVKLLNCEESATFKGLYIVSFYGDVPSPTGIVRTELGAYINQNGAIQSSGSLAVAAGYFTDTNPNADLSRESLDRMLLEIDEWRVDL